MRNYERCKRCGIEVVMMVMRGTGFCCQNHQQGKP